MTVEDVGATAETERFGMSELMRGLLAMRMQEEGMSPNVPVSVAELHRRLLPYPMCRDRLGYASKAEYDVDLLELLSDTRLVDVPEAALREAVRGELGSPEPGLAVLQSFAASEIRLLESAADAGPETGPPIVALETGMGRGGLIPGLDDPLLVPQDEAADALGGPALEVLPGRSGPANAAAPSASGEDDSVSAESRKACRSCGAGLPDREGVRFCPRCGSDQWSWPCPACGEDVARGWRYCALCGKLLPTR